MKGRSYLIAAVIGGTLAGAGCTSPTPKGAPEQSTLASETSTALTTFKNDDPTLQTLIAKSVGYAVFPEVGKAGFIAGASYGNGEVFEGGRKIGYADITQASVGLQAGAQTFGELILFLRHEDLNKFKENSFSLDANLSAVALKSGAAAATDTSKGVIVFVRSKGGLMAEASVGGQRFLFKPLGAPTTEPAK